MARLQVYFARQHIEKKRDLCGLDVIHCTHDAGTSEDKGTARQYGSAWDVIMDTRCTPL